MATIAEITQDLRQTYKSAYLSATDVSTYMGVMQRDARRYLAEANVPYITVGECDRRRKYHVKDVSKMIFARQVRK